MAVLSDLGTLEKLSPRTTLKTNLPMIWPGVSRALDIFPMATLAKNYKTYPAEQSGSFPMHRVIVSRRGPPPFSYYFVLTKYPPPLCSASPIFSSPRIAFSKFSQLSSFAGLHCLTTLVEYSRPSALPLPLSLKLYPS